MSFLKKLRKRREQTLADAVTAEVKKDIVLTMVGRNILPVNIKKTGDFFDFVNKNLVFDDGTLTYQKIYNKYLLYMHGRGKELKYPSFCNKFRREFKKFTGVEFSRQKVDGVTRMVITGLKLDVS